MDTAYSWPHFWGRCSVRGWAGQRSRLGEVGSARKLGLWWPALDLLEVHKGPDQREVFFHMEDLMNVDVDVIFCYTTSPHFDADETDAGPGRGNQLAGGRKYPSLRQENHRPESLATHSYAPMSGRASRVRTVMSVGELNVGFPESTHGDPAGILKSKTGEPGEKKRGSAWRE